MTPEERRSAILTLLETDRRLRVAALAERYATSEDSIRRDLRRLEADGLIRRVHGAVLPIEKPRDFADRIHRAAGTKADLADLVVPLIEDGMTVILDGGTTVLAVAAAFPAGRRVTVATGSLPAALALADVPGVEVICPGGRLLGPARTTVGPAAVTFFRQLRADLCLVGPCSFDPDAGLSTDHFEEAEVKRAMIAASARVVAVTTADKLGTASAHLVAPVSGVDLLVTDTAAPADLLDAFAARGVRILQPETPAS